MKALDHIGKEGKYFDELTAVKIQGRWSFIDNSTARTSILPRFDPIGGLDAKDLLLMNENKDWVLVNRLGKSIISLGKYSHVQLILRSGLAQVRLVGKWGLMNQELKLFLEP